MRMACARWGRRLVLAGALLGGLLPGAGFAQAPAASAPAASAQGSRPLPADLPLKRDVPGQAEGPPWVALLVLLGLAGGAGLLVLRRRGAAGVLRAWQRPQGGAGIERLASQPLTPQASVHAVRWHGEELLLGCTGTQVTVLARHPATNGARQEG